jgi:energy-coupling factor transporter ATP-binding protein EcfA2
MAQYVMSMLRVSKVVPPKRQIIKDISLSFFPGAKIGLLGLNGAGKSTVLKIMAGVEKEYDGEVQRLAGISIGYLPQEPQLDPGKTVRDEVESRPWAKSCRPRRSLEEVYAAYAEPDADFDKLAEEQARLEAIICRLPAPTPSTRWRSPPTPCACRPGMPDRQALRRRESAASPCASCCCRNPTCCCWTSPPTTWTPNRWNGWNNSWCASPAPWWPSPTTATSSTTPPSGSSNSTGATAFPGRATTRPGWSRRRPVWRPRTSRSTPT